MDELDRQARRKARRVGQSQPRSASPVDKRPIGDQEIGPTNGGFLLSSLYLCRLTFCVTDDTLAFLVMLYVWVLSFLVSKFQSFVFLFQVLLDHVRQASVACLVLNCFEYCSLVLYFLRHFQVNFVSFRIQSLNMVFLEE